jgi:hypothetical protein
MEQYILPHIRFFFTKASGEEIFHSESKCWSADVSQWGNYLTFDVMGDLVFGKDFGMLAGNESRELPGIIDGAAHRELLVFLLLKMKLNITAFLSISLLGRVEPIHQQMGSG